MNLEDRARAAIKRCQECGSYEAQCAADNPVKGCGCARCLSAENAALRKRVEELELAVDVAESRKSHVLRDLVARAEKAEAALKAAGA